MCLILVSYQQHPFYPLIVAANRDEFYERKTSPSQFWDDYPEILAGRDLEGMGTWMGIHKSGKIGMVTNYRDLSQIKSNAPSRGKLVLDFLANGDLPSTYLMGLEKRAKEYNGFNLLVGYPEDLWYGSNYGKGFQKIEPGIHGLSNHLLNTPWPKVMRGKNKFKELLDAERVDPVSLLDMLYDEGMAPDDLLPETGVGIEWERKLSSIFIKSSGYGSRSSTVFMIDNQNTVKYIERNYHLEDYSYQDRLFEFKINLPSGRQ